MMRNTKRSVATNEDTPAMADAISVLEELKIPIFRPSKHQLKYGSLNFWPSTGRITIDPDRKCDERGLSAFVELARERRDNLQARASWQIDL